MKIELDQKVKDKLAEAVELWADDNLEGKPALLANAMYFALERAMLDQIKQINETFGD